MGGSFFSGFASGYGGVKDIKARREYRKSLKGLQKVVDEVKNDIAKRRNARGFKMKPITIPEEGFEGSPGRHIRRGSDLDVKPIAEQKEFSMKRGGVVRETGIYRLHKGERILTAREEKARNKKKRTTARSNKRSASRR